MRLDRHAKAAAFRRDTDGGRDDPVICLTKKAKGIADSQVIAVQLFPLRLPHDRVGAYGLSPKQKKMWRQQG